MADQEVTYEDQQKINQFGRLTQKLHELEAQQRSAEKKKLNIQDAMTEMMLADEGTGALKYRIGESYVDLDEDAANEMLEKEEASIDAVIADVHKKIEDIKATLSQLKVELYGKFGHGAINLEED